MPDDEDVGQEQEIDLSQPAPETETDVSADGDEGADQPQPQPDPTEEKIAAMQKRLDDQDQQLRRFVGQNNPLANRNRMPAAFSKPREHWTVDDLWQANQWQLAHQAELSNAENRVRGSLNASVLGDGNDYDTVINKYVVPFIDRNPEIGPIIAQWPAEDRYMLGLMHEIHARSGGNLVNTIKALRNPLGARHEGAKDLTTRVNQAAKGAALRIFQGGGGRQSGTRPTTAKDVWDMSDEAFRAAEAKASGR